jgi:hypothetical protein
LYVHEFGFRIVDPRKIVTFWAAGNLECKLFGAYVYLNKSSGWDMKPHVINDLFDSFPDNNVVKGSALHLENDP